MHSEYYKNQSLVWELRLLKAKARLGYKGHFSHFLSLCTVCGNLISSYSESYDTELVSLGTSDSSETVLTLSFKLFVLTVHVLFTHLRSDGRGRSLFLPVK